MRQFPLAEGATTEDLFRNRIHLFSGDAADFVALTPTLHDWDQLVSEVTRWVRGSNSDYDRLRMIETKKQGRTESSAVYILRMELLFRSLVIGSLKEISET